MIESDELSYPEEVHHEALFMHDEGVIQKCYAYRNYNEEIERSFCTYSKYDYLNFGTQNGQNCKCY